MTVLSLIPILAAIGAQGHDVKPADAMKSVAFMAGDWKGKQDFKTPNGSMVGEFTDHAEVAVGGRFIYEHLSTTLPGRPATDTRHMLCYDPATQKYVAYWFNDTSSLPMQLTGMMEGNKLVMSNSPSKEGAPALRFTYEKISDNHLSLSFEMKQGDGWQLLFKTDYSK